MLNIPTSLLDIIRDKNNILIAGIGGGFDVYGGLPLFYTLEKLGKQVFLANYSFSDFDKIRTEAAPQIINENLYVAGSQFEVRIDYYPEGYLSKWFQIGFNRDVPVYMFNKTGTNPLTNSYRYIIQTHQIDLIVLIDGGVDSLNTGHETGHGTIIEDTITIAALSEIQEMPKIVMCVGFGTEVEEKICGYNVLLNMANIIKNDGFLGSCSLVKESNSFRFYKNACQFTFSQQKLLRTSHIHRRIIPATEGEFGDIHMTDEDVATEIFLSPLMSICWFFKFDALFLYNRLVPYVSDSNTFYEVIQKAMPYINQEKGNLPRKSIPY